jgi:peptidoglycan/LPS O-acetylase OafA/YrhL
VGKEDVRAAGRRVKAYASPRSGLAWLRLICACVVVFDHSGSVAKGWGVPVLPATWQLPLGDMALMALFVMSGYQVSGSWTSDPSWWRFCLKRLLRILPPLWVVLVVAVFVVGPLLTTWSLGDYFSHPQTWRYLVGSSVVLLIQHNLPGVFYENPYPWTVNGSLWTLPMEIAGYVVLLAVGLLVALRVSRMLVLIPLLAAIVALDAMNQQTLSEGGTIDSFLSMSLVSLVYFMVPFVFGAVLHAGRDRIPLLRVPALLLLGIWFFFRGDPAGHYLLPLAFGYGTIVLAHHWPSNLGYRGKWVMGSYGMYLWGFLVQQLIAAAGVRDPWLLAALAVPAAYLFGVLSWVFVETPTQRLRHRLKSPRPAPESLDRELLLQH